jgi:SAM-dependent methyltransferase
MLTGSSPRQPARARVRQQVNRLLRPVWLGTLRRRVPISRTWGYDRGCPVDRYYIERFLERHRAGICGRVLEVKDSTYTDRFGSAVSRRDVLDKDPSNRRATIIADLTAAPLLEPDMFDCCIVTQTLQDVFEVGAAVTQLHRVLKPGGILLATLPAVSRIDSEARYGDYWRFTPAACVRLFGAVFGTEHVTVEGHGNVLTSIAFLAGMAKEDLSRDDLDANDPLYPVIVTVCAVKSRAARPAAPAIAWPG